MTLYCCNGVVRVLETGVIYGSSNPAGHKYIPAAKRIEKYAKKELRSDNNFVNLYSEVEWVREAIKEGEAFFMSVVGNCSLVLGCSTFKVSSRIAPYFKNGEGKFERLWLTERFEPKMAPEHLNVHILAAKLNKIIGCFQLELGELRYKNSHKAIAWELTNEKGTFYIPWHNGCIIEKKTEESDLSFEKKELKDMSKVYCALRFEEESKGAYRVVCC